MKKSKLSLLILLLIIFTITSCKNTPELQSQPGSKPETISNSNISSQLSSQPLKLDVSGKDNLWADKKLTVSYISPGASSSWSTVCHNNIKHAAWKWNINLSFLDGSGKAELQIEEFKKQLERNVDAIILSPFYETGWDELFEKARAKNIPVILCDRYADCADESLWTTYIVNDYYKEGEIAGRWLIEYLYKQGKLDEEIRILELTGPQKIKAYATQENGYGFREIIKEYENIEIIDSVDGYFTQAKGYEEMSNKLQETTDIDVLYCHNDNMAIGAIQAIEEAGLVPGEDIIIVSIMGTDAALEAIVEGKIACSVETNPLLGDLLMEACVRIANGEEIEREIHPVDRVFDITNAQEKLDTGYGY